MFLFNKVIQRIAYLALACSFARGNEMDPNSVADPSKFVTTHVDLDWLVDFDKKTISGSVTLTMDCKDSQDAVLELDAHHLIVKGVQINGAQAQFEYNVDGAKFGDVLRVPYSNGFGPFKVKIDYETTDKGEALQWLNPEQTSGKKYPFLFSQCQAILARTLLPCQDTPAIKAPYTATVMYTPFFGFNFQVLMSANKRYGDDHGGPNVFHFEQTTPIPSYLIAIGAGDLEPRQLGSRCTVWAEPAIIEAAAYEFAHAEKFLEEAESLNGPYVWGIYDMLVLPPSFPYGGMENPCLTFLTPSLLAGDRSLVAVVIHEITHSWTGNLVTNANWENFWLNEGFTKFVERKLIGRLEGEPLRELLAQIGQYDLQEAVRLFGPNANLAKLRPDLSEISPDDGYSIIPYEKGHALLYHIEKTVGGATVFDKYLRAHIEHFSGQSITTVDWLNFMLDYFEKNEPHGYESLKKVDFETWLHGPGMPPVPIIHDQTLITAVKATVENWKTGTWNKSNDQWDQFGAHQKVIFLDMLNSDTKGSLPHDTLTALDSAYGLSSTTNVEVGLKWFLLCLANGYEPAFKAAAHYATQHGRMKYCRPILRELYRQPKGKQLALDTFETHRSFYHPQAVRMIAKDLEINI